MKATIALSASIVLMLCATGFADTGNEFTADELAVAKFWEDMGPTLREHGIGAYSARYHEDFRHWDLGNGGRLATKESAVKAWTRYHEGGHRITCTFVKPVGVRIMGDHAFARLIYEQTDTMADGNVTTSFWRIVGVFERKGDSWQVLDTNMLDITESVESDPQKDYARHCKA